jgi:hypothetical protein
MRKLLVALPLLALFGCDNRSPSQVEQDNRSEIQRDAAKVLAYSTVMCADGNQVRLAVYALGGNASAFSGWTILNDDGTPKKCVRRVKSLQPQYEEVPQ